MSAPCPRRHKERLGLSIFTSIYFTCQPKWELFPAVLLLAAVPVRLQVPLTCTQLWQLGQSAEQAASYPGIKLELSKLEVGIKWHCHTQPCLRFCQQPDQGK